ncbi:hypothetical protein [Armatimonas rosea]|uniref:Uncharacterized protein n=1 Tax=Armatimonas rosea TaxID=685828 RepID=A0A7W9SQQ5_ARMRO|nr:hypothetical protein [Armatimonas rosea]MBB6051087.1 hypothetical protein [Armatimonas rosea]
MSTDNTALRGKALYQEHIRSLVETQESLGKIVAIDIESGDYEIDSDLLVASRRLRIRHASARIWAERIGYNAVYAVGGTRTRTTIP